MDNNNVDYFKPVEEMSDEEMKALIEDWDIHVDDFLGYELKEDKRKSCERIETLYRKLHTLNENIEIKPGGIDNRSSHASYRLQFHGSFLPMEKPILEAFSELFSLADTVVTSMTDHGFLTTIVVRNIWATFVELPKDDSSMFDIDE